MDSYLSTQRSTIFQHVGVLIYVFDVESREMEKDLDYYRDCLESLKKFSPEAVVFILVHKMDLARPRQKKLDEKTSEIQKASGDVGITVFGTSIYDESLYKVSISGTLQLRILNLYRHGRASCIHSFRMLQYSPSI